MEASSNLPGRVVRLHFTCKAELPMGSQLRVTGSTLWAPTSLTSSQDPMNAHAIAQKQASESFPTTADEAMDGVASPAGASPTAVTTGAAAGVAAGVTAGVTTGVANSNNNNNNNNAPPAQSSSWGDDSYAYSQALGLDSSPNATASALYTSSIEMVTTPETYPIWKTKTPVILVLHKNSARNKIQHHYFRYLVVTPGASLDSIEDDMSALRRQSQASFQSSLQGSLQEDAHADSMDNDQLAMLTAASTTNEFGTSTPVMMWENPFEDTLAQNPTQPNANASSFSRKSASRLTDGRQSASSSMASLTTATGTIWDGEASNPATIMQHLANLPYRTLDIHTDAAQCMVPDDDRLDAWDCPDDDSFRHYRIRSSISDQQQQVQAQSQGQTHTQQQAQTQTQGAALATPTKLMKRVSDISDDFMEDAAAHLASGGSTTPPAKGSWTTPPPRSANSMLPPLRQDIFFICFHLPVVVVQDPTTKEWSAAWNESLLARSEGSKIVDTMSTQWVGTVTSYPPMKTDEDRETVSKILADMNCTPIFVPPEIRQDHYYGFCKQVLWPAFHNIDLLDLSTSGLIVQFDDGSASSNWDQSRLDNWWTAYQKVNRQFATVVESLVTPDSTLWIHDYHLSLLPTYLKDSYPRNSALCRKVFFLHIPFPTSQIFRELECGEAILEGMLHADVVGFHAFDHARHFLNAAKRILGLNYESLIGGLIGVQYKARTVLVSMSNVSIEPRQLNAALSLPTVDAGCMDLKKKHGKRKIIGGVDIGQRLSGISLKLLAYERLLHDYPSWQKKVVMVQRVLVPGTRLADEQSTTRELRGLVQRIQTKFGPSVIDYSECIGSSLPMDLRLALWKATDVFMCTPIREGLNHWPMEYIYSKSKDHAGVVITSEFSSVCSILNGALRVNPFDIQMTITIIDKALIMDHQEREGRRYRDIDFVSNSPSDKWVHNVLRDLRDATRKPTGGAGSGAGSSCATPADGGSTPFSYTPRTNRDNSQLQGTAAFLAKEAVQAFAHLNMRKLKQAYDRTTKRVLILDFNGTIVLKEPPGKYLKREILGTSGNKPPPQVLDALGRLCNDPRNTVYVVSGDSSDNVINALGHIPNLGLAVSNGAKFSAPMVEGETERRWQTFDLGVDWEAVKAVAHPVLSKYTARSNGSFVKLTKFSIGWSYYSCDPEWGSLQASHLVLELESELRAFDVRFVTLKGIIEVVPRRLNKGLIVKKVLRDISQQSHGEEGLDFIMCMGDDISDEKMFTSVFSFIAEMDDADHVVPGPPVLNEDGTPEDKPSTAMVPAHGDAAVHGQESNSMIRDPLYAYTVAVGKKPSHASMWVNDAQEVANILVLLGTGTLPAGGVPVWQHENATHLFT